MITVKIYAEGNFSEIKTFPGATLSDIIRTAGLDAQTPCGGRGTCLRCRVKASGGLSEPDGDELRAFDENSIADGWRLACKSKALSDAVVCMEQSQIFENILTTGAVTGFARDPVYQNYGMSIDIGTTTISAQLYGKGCFLHAASMKNPQTAFGADVITRIEKSMAGYAQALSDAILDAIIRLLTRLASAHGIDIGDIDALVITGNTAMLYLLTGQNPETLSHAPFEADTLFGGHYALPAIDADIYLPRCMSAFVGADITTAVLASGMCDGDETSLLADIGTNGEIALWHRGRLYCCSTAAGPAFEGAGIYMGTYGINGAIDKVWLEDGKIRLSTIGGQKPSGICGSGIVDAISMMLKADVIDETGSLQEDGHSFLPNLTEINGSAAFCLGDGIVITARDIRNVQLAKGSVRAGIETLLHTAGVEHGDIQRLYIAGGFGGYLNLKSAADIGLIPPNLAPKAKSIGNAAQAGASMILENREFIRESQMLANSAETVTLSANPVFVDNYMQYMMFDTAPHLKT